MACFLVPGTEAVVTTILKKKMDKQTNQGNPFMERIGWLNNMLWGGSALLAFEHIWHGEIVPWFPFLTKAGNATEALEMLREMATSGVAMAVLVTLTWMGMVAVTSKINEKAVAVPVEKEMKKK